MIYPVDTNLEFTPTPVSPPPNAAGPFSYAWDFGDSGTSTTAVPTHAYASPGSFSPSVVATNDATGESAYSINTVEIVGGSSQTNVLVTGRAYHETILLNDGRVLIVGGFNGWKPAFDANAGMSSCELYDPTTGLFSSTGSLAQGRGQGHRLALLPNGDVIVVGGRNTGQNNVAWTIFGGSEADNRSSCEIYSVADGTWSTTDPLPIGTRDHAIAVLPSGKVMIFGGATATPATVSNTYIYDHDTGVWTAGPALPKDLWGATAITLSDGRIFITGGYSTVASTGSSFNASSYVYTEGGSYAELAVYPLNIGGSYAGQIRSIVTPTVAQYGDSIIVCGGFCDSAIDYQKYVYSYSLSGNTWSQLPVDTTSTSFSQCKGCRTPNGAFYTVAGTSPRLVSSLFSYILNPVAKTIWGASTQYLGNGYVMVCGGTDNSAYQAAIKDAYLFYVGA